MVKPMNRLRACTGFQWNKGNDTKNWDSHDVSRGEYEQVFFNQPLVAGRDRRHSVAETRYYVLGRTDADRLLFIAFAVREDKIRVISAREMMPNEEQRYDQ